MSKKKNIRGLRHNSYIYHSLKKFKFQVEIHCETSKALQ